MPAILVVDDDLQFVASAENLLHEAGYQVLTATDGGRAMDLLERLHGDIGLAIVDLALPTVNGFELIGAIARRPGPMKIIATTSVYKDYHLQLVETLGAHAVIRKPPAGIPLPAKEWLETIRLLLGSSSNSVGGR
jgi:CheY-like chemotaxis protein